MSVWSNNNKAALATWTTLKALDQIQKNKSFKKTKDMVMEDLTFWIQSSTGLARGVRADALSKQLHNMNSLIWGAVLESGESVTKATSEMANILKDKNKTVQDLTEVMDTKYHFLD